MSELRYALGLMGRHAPRLLGAQLLQALVLAILLNIVPGFMARDVVNAATSGDQQLLLRGIMVMLVAFAIGVPLNLLTIYLIGTSLPRIMNDIRARFIAHATALPLNRLEREHSGMLMARATTDVDGLRGLFHWEIGRLSFGLIVGAAALLATLAMSPPMAAVVLINGLVTIISNVLIARPLRARSDVMQQRLGAMTERFSDLLQSLPLAKMFHMHRIVQDKFATENQAYTAARLGFGLWWGSLTTLNVMRLDYLNVFVTLAAGLWLVSRGQLDIGAVAAIGAFEHKANFIFQRIGEFVASLQRTLSHAKRVREVLEWPTEPCAPDDAPQCKIDAMDVVIEIQAMHFSYANGAEVLTDIDLSVPKGSTIALVGPSGSGKTTLLKLLLGFYPIERGAILIGGLSLGAHSLKNLRSQIAYISQESFLFDTSIRENLRFGRPGASDADIEQAARLAQAHDFIMAIQGGYDALVGERGVQLSGGQRQRIALARAILKDAPVLLLDEATSALDSESEAAVQQALTTLRQGRTTLVVAHRLSTVQSADLICMLEAGRISERGTHAELLGRRGAYSRMWAAGTGQ